MITVSSSSTRAYARMATAVALLGIGAANAAEDHAPANAAAQTTAASSQAPQANTVPLNSGASAQEFPSDPGKVTMQQLPNGTRLYRMNGQGMETLSAHIGADGKLEFKCSDQAESVAAKAVAEHAHEN